MPASMSPEFLLTSFVVVASPGTGVVITLAAALARGRRAGIVAAFGCTLGIVPHMALALTGLAALLNASPTAFAIVKYAGVAYLLYMAWGMLRSSGPLALPEGKEPDRPAGEVIVSAILANLLNPKLSIFFVAFLPQFMRADDPAPLATMLVLSGVFMAMTFAVFAVYAAFAAAVRGAVLARPRVMAWLSRAFAAAFGGLAVRLALTER